jgi:hypothetical protein
MFSIARRTAGALLRTGYRSLTVTALAAGDGFIYVGTDNGLDQSFTGMISICTYDGEQIRITQSVWRGHIGEPKTAKSSAPIPVIAPLARFLEQKRQAAGNPTSGLMFPNSFGRPMNFDMLAFQVIKPMLGKAGIQWYGWHAFRRGVGN